MKLSAFEVTRYLFLFTAIVLTVFGVGSILRVFGNPERTSLYIFYSLVFFGDAVLMWFCARQLPKKTKFIFFFSALVLALNIFPAILDQFGLVDFLFLLLNISTAFELFMSRKEFFTE